MRYVSACVLFLGVGFVIAGLSGCGESLGNTVNGTVKNKSGKAISGQIIFVDKNGKESMFPILNGDYKASKLTAGANDVLIKSSGVVAPGAVGGNVKDGKGEGITGQTAQEQGVAPAAKYASKGQLTYEVPAGKSEKNFELDD